jgi:TatD DNase family protein
MRIFESHAHLDFPDYDSDRDEVLERCRSVGVERIVNIGIDEATSRAALRLCDTYPGIFAAVGFHPAECPSYTPGVLRELLSHPKVRAIGEIGLDYYRDHHPRSLQLRVFEEQVRIALELGLPIVVHNREAHEDCVRVLEAYLPPRVVFHCFSGDEAFAERIFRHGWAVSFTGAVTYKNNGYAPVIRMAPREQYLIETDCPFLTPVPYRGQRNAPYHLPLVIGIVAEVRGETPEEVAEQTWRNGVEFFRTE